MLPGFNLTFKNRRFILIMLLILVPNILLIGVRLADGQHYEAVKSLFYLLVTFLILLTPLLLIGRLSSRLYFFLWIPYILLVPVICFSIVLTLKWPPKYLIYILFTTGVTEIREFLTGQAGWFIFSLTYYFVYFLAVWGIKTEKRRVNGNARFMWLKICIFLFVGLSVYRTIRNENVGIFSKSNSLKFIRETPMGIAFNMAKVGKQVLVEKNLNYSFQPIHVNRPDVKSEKEIYVLLLGESSRFDHWHINGYERPTSPNLDTLPGILTFTGAISPAYTTAISVPLMLSCLSAPDFHEPEANAHTIFEYFSAAGFYTTWLSNQHTQANRVGQLSRSATYSKYLACYQNYCYDALLLDELDTLLSAGHQKLFVVMQLMGSHYPYHYRYPGEFEFFRPAVQSNRHFISKQTSREKMINAYDNSILYTDFVLSEIIKRIANEQAYATVIFCSDHGEALFEGGNQGFGRGLRKPVAGLYRVPLFVWSSSEYNAASAEKLLHMQSNQQKTIATDDLIYSILDLAGFELDENERRFSFANCEYRIPQVQVFTSPQKLMYFNSLFLE